MADNITQAERLLATIMAARTRVRGLASGLPFEAASRLEARGTVGSTPAREDLEIATRVLETRVRARQEADVSPPIAPAAPEPPQEQPELAAAPETAPETTEVERAPEAEALPTEQSTQEVEAPLFADFLPAEDMDTQESPVVRPEPEPEPPADPLWDAPEDLAPAAPIAPPDAFSSPSPEPFSGTPAERTQPTADKGHYDFRRADPVRPVPVAAPSEPVTPAAPEPQAAAPVEETAPEPVQEEAADPALPLSPSDLPPILNAAPPARPRPKRKKLPPPHPALATAAPPSLAQPRAVAPRIVDPDAPHLAVVFEPSAAKAVETDLMPAPALTAAEPSTQPSLPSPAPVGSAVVFDTIAQAEASGRSGRLAEAITLYGDVLDLEPDHIEARLGRGAAYLNLGQFAAAMSDFQRAEDSAPEAPGPLAAMGDLFFARKDYSRAISQYDEALDRDPQHAMSLCRRGICHHYRGRADLALEDLVQARSLDPDIPSIDRYVVMVNSAATGR